MKVQTAFFLFFLFYAISGRAQPDAVSVKNQKPGHSSSDLNQQAEFLKYIYSQRIGNKKELICGREYVPYYYRSEHKPLLFNGEKHTASVFMEGRKYERVSVEYDTFTDELILADTSLIPIMKIYFISLNKDLLDGFNLYFSRDTMFFKNFRVNGDGKFNLPEGFYETVYDGSVKFIIRHLSRQFEIDGLPEYFYQPENYIDAGDGYVRIKSTEQFSAFFGERSKEVKKFIRKNKIKIRKAGKKEILSVLRYYDLLNASGIR